MVKYFLIGEKGTNLMKQDGAVLSYLDGGQWREEPKLISYLMGNSESVQVSEAEASRWLSEVATSITTASHR